jgi:hypothetical protein
MAEPTCSIFATAVFFGAVRVKVRNEAPKEILGI